MRRYYSKGGGADRMMSSAEKEFKAYNLMRDSMDREKFLKERKRQMEQDKKRLIEKRDGLAVKDGGMINQAQKNYRGSYISGDLGGVEVSNPSLRKYYKGML